MTLKKAKAINLGLHAKLQTPTSQHILTILEDNHYQACFVGGCVRDSILGRPITDIDIATTATPQQAISALKKAAIKTIPSGISHGTITALYQQQRFEITTLRQDVKTFGRHAEDI